MARAVAPRSPSIPTPSGSGRCEVSWRGRVPYGEAVAAMEAHTRDRGSGAAEDALWFLEHEPVITLGKSTAEGHVRASEADLAARGVALVPSTRGGDVTFHGPGQLVGYPIVNLRDLRWGARCYVYALEEALIRTVADYGIRADRIEGRTGVWVGDEKIAAIGVRISRGITSHGFALNVSTDLSCFDLIVPCGIRDAGVTSIAACAEPRQRSVTLGDVADRFATHFGVLSGKEMSWLTARP